MAIQEIRYGGMTAQPSDYENKDGELAVSVNLLNEEGHLSPLLPAEVVKELPSGTAAVYIHDTSKFKHYIVISTTGTISWIDETDMETTHSTGFTISGIKKVVPLGNTLCILHSGGMVYLLWKDGEYKELSPNLPEVKLSFGLQCEWEYENGYYSIVEDDTQYLSNMNNGVMGLLAKAIKEKCTDKNRFCMPFFVRYAYRLFDGSLTKQSQPILMLPMTGTPFVFISSRVAAQGQAYQNIQTDLPVCELDMDVMQIDTAFNDYEDIIQNVEIYISAPMYTYTGKDIDKENRIINIDEEDFSSHYGVYKLKSPMYGSASLADAYGRYTSLCSLITQTGAGLWSAHPEYRKRFNLPQSDLKNKIESCSTFYHLTNIRINELLEWNVRKKIDIAEDVLNTLLTRDTLEDDYHSHCERIPKVIHTYNERLLIGNVRERLADYYYNQAYTNKTIIEHLRDPHTITPSSPSQSLINEECVYWDSFDFLGRDTKTLKIQDVIIKVKKDGNTYTVHEHLDPPICTTGEKKDNNGDRYVQWVYYPDAGATEMDLFGYIDDESYMIGLKMELNLHPTLNGSYAVQLGWQPEYWNASQITAEGYSAIIANRISTINNNWYNLADKLYTSEVLNPWYFPVEGIVTVGNGELLALSAATQALSQGQFGEFPLYAFCSDGVWALTVGQTGYLTRSVPVSRDVCTNPESVLQIDDAVIYPTDRGLMLLAGSKNVCFTEPLNNREIKDYESQLPGMRELRAMAGLTAPSTYASVAERQHRCLNPAPLREFLQDCKMIYDYVGQKIVVYNPKKETYTNGQISYMYRKYKYALVYSLKTNLWGMIESDLQWTVNSYPEAMGMTDEKKLVRFSGPTPALPVEGGGSVTGLFVTRPLKLGAPDVLKTVRTVMQRGMFRRGDVKSVMWGSRDLYNWYLIHSSQDEGLHNMSGTPYKYLIIGGLVTLTEGKSVSGASLEVEAKMTDVLR